MTDKTTESEIAEILTDPFSRYDSPKDVVDDAGLSVADKRRILDAMEHDARELATAATENMAGGEKIALDEILDAQRQLPGG